MSVILMINLFNDVSAGRLPTDKNEAEQWVQFFHLDTCTKKDIRLCEKHFENHKKSIRMRQVNVRLVPPR